MLTIGAAILYYKARAMNPEEPEQNVPVPLLPDIAVRLRVWYDSMRESIAERSVEIEGELKSVEGRISTAQLVKYRDHLLRVALSESVAIANQALEDCPEDSLEAMRVGAFGS